MSVSLGVVPPVGALEGVPVVSAVATGGGGTIDGGTTNAD